MHPDYYTMLIRIKNHDISNILDLGDAETAIFHELERNDYVCVRDAERDYSQYALTARGRRVLAEEDQRISERESDLAYRRHQNRVETARYIITTAIALAALIKSFWPEISAAAARLLILLAHR